MRHRCRGVFCGPSAGTLPSRPLTGASRPPDGPRSPPRGIGRRSRRPRGAHDDAATHRRLRMALPDQESGVLGRLPDLLSAHLRRGHLRPDPDRQPRQRAPQRAVCDPAADVDHEPVHRLHRRRDGGRRRDPRRRNRLRADPALHPHRQVGLPRGPLRRRGGRRAAGDGGGPAGHRRGRADAVAGRGEDRAVSPVGLPDGAVRLRPADVA